MAKTRPRPARTRWWLAFLAAVFVAYVGALKAPFVYDDIPAIVQNESIRTLTPISRPFDPPENTPLSGRPVANVSFALNHALNHFLGLDIANAESAGYRAVNVLLHLAAGLLLFAVVGRTLRPYDLGVQPSELAGFAALLWLVHPIQTEAVIYITQRTELLVSFFYLGTLYASIRAWEGEGGDDAGARERRKWYSIGVVCCALGMWSKEVMFTAPLAVVLYDRAFRASSWRELLANRERRFFYLALVATTGIVVASIAGRSRASSVGFAHGITWYEYLYTQAWAIGRYLRLLLWPTGFVFDYGDRPIHGARGVPGLLLLTALGVWTVFAWAKNRRLWAAFSGAWFFLLLAPSSSFVPISTEVAAERRIYLASAPLFVLVVLGAFGLQRRRKIGVTVMRAVLAGLALVLVGLTIVRGRTYRDTETLYRDLVERVPENPRAHIGLGLTLIQRNPDRAAEAESSLRKALALDSSSFVAWRTLGIVKLMQGDWRRAVPALERALAQKPGSLDLIVGLGRAHVELGDAAAARPYVDQIGTADLDLLWSLGALLVERGQSDVALRYLEKAASEGNPPSRGLALMSLAYANAGRSQDAVSAARIAIADGAEDPRVFVYAGRAMTALGRRDEARAYLTHALSLDANSIEAKAALDALGKRGR
jgi:Flp pilus assembly protein TadD